MTVLACMMWCFNAVVGAEDYVLYWMLDNNPIYDNGQQVKITDIDADYARIFMIPSEDGSSLELMQLTTGSRSTRRVVGDDGVVYHDAKQIYMTGTMAIVDTSTGWFGWNTTYETGETVYADLTAAGFRPENATQYKFYIELGIYENDRWISSAVTDMVSYSDLSDQIQQVERFTSNGKEYLANWSYPNGYYDDWGFNVVVPEPTTLHLFLMGLGLVSLLRRRPI